METWVSPTIRINGSVHIDVKANENGVVLAQGDEVWFHDLHLTSEQAADIAAALYQGALYCLRAQLEARK